LSFVASFLVGLSSGRCVSRTRNNYSKWLRCCNDETRKKNKKPKFERKSKTERTRNASTSCAVARVLPRFRRTVRRIFSNVKRHVKNRNNAARVLSVRKFQNGSHDFVFELWKYDLASTIILGITRFGADTKRKTSKKIQTREPERSVKRTKTDRMRSGCWDEKTRVASYGMLWRID